MKKRIRLNSEEMKAIDNNRPLAALRKLRKRKKLTITQAKSVVLNYRDHNKKSTMIES